mgnify:FL=1
MIKANFNNSLTKNKTFENIRKIKCKVSNQEKRYSNMNKKEQEFLVQKIRTQYTEREHTQLDELKKLDTKVKKPAKIFAYLFGSAGALIMGVGMSLTMTDIGSAIGIESTLTPGIVIGLAGIFMAAINYPVYKSMLNNRRKKYADKIIAISDSIMEG